MGYYFDDVVKKYVFDNVKKYRNAYLQNVGQNGWDRYRYCNFDMQKCDTEFEFLWFMAALYHDISSFVEKNDNKNIKWNEKCNMDVIDIIARLKNLNFAGEILSPFELKDVSVEDILLGDIECKKNLTFSKSEVAEYFNYGLSKVRGHQSINHGIVAGYLLFSKMVDILHCKYVKGNISDFSVEEGGLLFERTDIFAYQMAADAIIAHNIWFAEDSTDDENFKNFQKYADLKHVSDVHQLMGRFIYSEKKDVRLSLEKNPLAFWLGLMDTIEPLKYFKKNSKYFSNEDRQFLLNNLVIYIDGSRKIKMGLLSENSMNVTINDLKEWEK